MRSYYSFGIYLELSNPPKTKTGKPIIGARLDRKTDYWSKIETENRLLEQDWTGKPIIGARLKRKTDYWSKIGPENRLLAQDWVHMIRLENRFLGQENRFPFRSLGKHTREDTPKTPGTGKPIIGTRLHRKADYIGARLDRKTDY